MQSNNPVLSRPGSFSSGARGGFGGADAPMTMDDVVVRSATLLGTLAVVGAAAWVLQVPLGIAMIAGIGALVLGLIGSFKRTTTPALFMGYAILEGVVLGAVSRSYESAYTGIVVQAVLGVVLVFGVMLALYKSRVIRVTARFTKILLAAAIAFVALLLVNIVASFIVPGGLGLTSGGPLAIGFAIVGVVIGALFYALDFDQAERLVAAGVPQKEAWRVGFGLTLTTVWVYVNLLRLLSFFRE